MTKKKKLLIAATAFLVVAALAATALLLFFPQKEPRYEITEHTAVLYYDFISKKMIACFDAAEPIVLDRENRTGYAMAPDNCAMLYTIDNKQLYLLYNNGKEVLVSSADLRVEQFGFSVNGEYVFYKQDGRLYVVNREDFDDKWSFADTESKWLLALSPDWKTAVYYSVETKEWLLYHNGSETKITLSQYAVVGVSNNGKYIYSIVKAEDYYDSGLYDLYVQKGANGKAILLAENCCEYITNRDGTEILFRDTEDNLYVSVNGKPAQKLLQAKMTKFNFITPPGTMLQPEYMLETKEGKISYFCNVATLQRLLLTTESGIYRLGKSEKDTVQISSSQRAFLSVNEKELLYSENNKTYRIADVTKTKIKEMLVKDRALLSVSPDLQQAYFYNGSTMTSAGKSDLIYMDQSNKADPFRSVNLPSDWEERLFSWDVDDWNEAFVIEKGENVFYLASGEAPRAINGTDGNVFSAKIRTDHLIICKGNIFALTMDGTVFRSINGGSFQKFFSFDSTQVGQVARKASTVWSPSY